MPVTTFAPIATGGTPQQPITSFNYQNIGVNIDITPRTHHDDDVTLALKVGGHEHLGERLRRPADVRQPRSQHRHPPARRRDEHAGGIDSRRRAARRSTAFPGSSDIPVVGRLFAHNQKTTEQTDIILTLTPHIIRVLDLTEADLRPFRVGRDGVSPLAELPLPVEPPKPPEPPKEEPPPVKKPGGGRRTSARLGTYLPNPAAAS